MFDREPQLLRTFLVKGKHLEIEHYKTRRLMRCLVDKYPRDYNQVLKDRYFHQLKNLIIVITWETDQMIMQTYQPHFATRWTSHPQEIYSTTCSIFSTTQHYCCNYISLQNLILHCYVFMLCFSDNRNDVFITVGLN